MHFPIIPIVKSHKKEGVKLYKRNPKLYTPSDFDYSPYFEIIKYPIFELGQEAVYRTLPWSEHVLSDDEKDTFSETDAEAEEKE